MHRNCEAELTCILPSMAVSAVLKILKAAAVLLLLLAACPVYVFRWLLSRLSWCKEGFGKILSTQSALFEAFPSFHVGISLEVGGSMNADRILDLLSRRMVFLKDPDGAFAYPEFQQTRTTWFGFSFWKWEEKFDIEEHISFFPKTSPAISNVAAFKEGMAFVEQSLPGDRSPWAAVVIEKEASFLFVFKFHHALADGYAIFNALIKCCDVPATLIRPLHGKATWKQQFQQRLKFLRSFFSKTSAPLASVAQGLGKETSWDMPSALMHSEKLYGLTAPIPMGGAKALGKEAGVSLSSVLLAGIAGGVRKFLGKARDEKGTSLLCDFPLPAPRHPEGLTNCLLAVHFELPLLDEELSLSSLKIHTALKAKLAEMEPEKNTFISRLLEGLPTHFMAKLPMHFPPLCCSIFPGPKERVTFDVFPVVDMYFTLNAHRVNPCVITVFSYNGFFRILINMDRNICKTQDDMDRITKYVQEAFDGV